MNILISGGTLDYNFGTPSLLHGTVRILRQVFGAQAEICFLQNTPVSRLSAKDFDIQLIDDQYSEISLYLEALRYRTFGPLIKNKSKQLEAILRADLVVDIFGICFADNGKPVRHPYIRTVYSTMKRFSAARVAHILKKKTAKSTASYGPMQIKYSEMSARYAARHAFCAFIAREQESKRAIETLLGKTVAYCPDSALMMPFKREDTPQTHPVILSVSHKIESKWEANEPYLHCMVALCRHIRDTLGLDVALLPNECNVESTNDIAVCHALRGLLLKEDIGCTIIDALSLSASQTKSIIAGAEVLVASRYHSCVAGLSSGVPTLVIGWHNKYNELLGLFHQTRWHISSADCTSDGLIAIFDAFWGQRQQSRQTIEEAITGVQTQILNTQAQVYRELGMEMREDNEGI